MIDFDDFEMPVSEETLGAYLDGMLSDSEMQNVEQWLAADPRMKSLVDDLSSHDLMNQMGNDLDFLNGGMDFSLPEIPQSGVMPGPEAVSDLFSSDDILSFGTDRSVLDMDSIKDDMLDFEL